MPSFAIRWRVEICHKKDPLKLLCGNRVHCYDTERTIVIVAINTGKTKDDARKQRERITQRRRDAETQRRGERDRQSLRDPFSFLLLSRLLDDFSERVRDRLLAAAP